MPTGTPPRKQALLVREIPYGQSCQVECPKCKKKTRARLKTTRQGPANSIKRTRCCLECGSNFTTYERIEERRPINSTECKELLRTAFAALGRALEKMP